MADKKISQLTPATTPLAGTEELPIVQGGNTVKVSVNNLTAGKAVTASQLTVENNSSNDAVRITQTGAGNALVVEDDTSPDASPFVVKASGNVGIGTSSPTRRVTIFNNDATNNTSVPTLSLHSDRNDRGASLDVVRGALSSVIGLAISTSDGADPVERMRINPNGNVGIGTSSPNASALLDVQSTTKGFRLPNMTTTQKNAISSPAAGLMVFDTTLGKACVYTGSAWQTITSA